MERRRKALGLRKQSTGKEKLVQEIRTVITPKKSKPNGDNESSRLEETTLNTVGKESTQASSDYITSQLSTPKRDVKVPQSSVSSGLQSTFPSVLGSPEIEVSWDWGCSQVPKDMLPPPRGKRQPQQPSVMLSPVVHEPRVLQSRQVSEEETKERLAFYKNVLSQASKCTKEETSKNNCSDDKDNFVQPNLSTPKRPTKSPTTERETLNDLLDDSANEFMLACSQVIEEKLKTGEINIGAVVSIKIPNQKHALSPDLELEQTHKRVCNSKSKLNLFPEFPGNVNKEATIGPVGKHRLSLRSPKSALLKNQPSCALKSHLVNSDRKNNLEDISKRIISVPNSVNREVTTNTEANTEDLQRLRLNEENKSATVNWLVENTNVSALERRLPNLKQQKTLNNNCISYKNSIQPKAVQDNVNNFKYDSVDKFRRTSKGVCDSNRNQNVYKANKVIDSVTHNLPTEKNPPMRNTPTNDNKTRQGIVTNKIQETKTPTDFTSLLDDGFDMELSSLDFDSICSNYQEPKVPKVCSKAEIEAKRKAALSRLKMKMRR